MSRAPALGKLLVGPLPEERLLKVGDLDEDGHEQRVAAVAAVVACQGERDQLRHEARLPRRGRARQQDARGPRGVAGDAEAVLRHQPLAQSTHVAYLARGTIGGGAGGASGGGGGGQPAAMEVDLEGHDLVGDVEPLPRQGVYDGRMLAAHLLRIPPPEGIEGRAVEQRRGVVEWMQPDLDLPRRLLRVPPRRWLDTAPGRRLGDRLRHRPLAVAATRRAIAARRGVGGGAGTTRRWRHAKHGSPWRQLGCLGAPTPASTSAFEHVLPAALFDQPYRRRHPHERVTRLAQQPTRARLLRLRLWPERRFHWLVRILLLLCALLYPSCLAFAAAGRRRRRRLCDRHVAPSAVDEHVQPLAGRVRAQAQRVHAAEAQDGHPLQVGRLEHALLDEPDRALPEHRHLLFQRRHLLVARLIGSGELRLAVRRQAHEHLPLRLHRLVLPQQLRGKGTARRLPGLALIQVDVRLQARRLRPPRLPLGLEALRAPLRLLLGLPARRKPRRYCVDLLAHERVQQQGGVEGLEALGDQRPPVAKPTRLL